MTHKYSVILIVWFLGFGTLFAGKIRVAMAANVSYASQPLIDRFQKLHPEIGVEVIFGSSGKLTAQIQHGAPFDMFMSADMKYPKKLYMEGLSATKPVVYAIGTLALFSLKKRDYSEGLHILQDPHIQKIAMANPKTAPYGIAAKEALLRVRLYEKIKDKFVYGESISQTVSYAKTAADIGIVATSALYAPQMKIYQKSIHWIEVDASLYAPIEQGMVILTGTKHEGDVETFYAFMLSKEAKEILKQYGYKV